MSLDRIIPEFKIERKQTHDPNANDINDENHENALFNDLKHHDNAGDSADSADSADSGDSETDDLAAIDVNLLNFQSKTSSMTAGRRSLQPQKLQSNIIRTSMKQKSVKEAMDSNATSMSHSRKQSENVFFVRRISLSDRALEADASVIHYGYEQQLTLDAETPTKPSNRHALQRHDTAGENLWHTETERLQPRPPQQQQQPQHQQNDIYTTHTHSYSEKQMDINVLNANGEALDGEDDDEDDEFESEINTIANTSDKSFNNLSADHNRNRIPEDNHNPSHVVYHNRSTADDEPASDYFVPSPRDEDHDHTNTNANTNTNTNANANDNSSGHNSRGSEDETGSVICRSDTDVLNDSQRHTEVNRQSQIVQPSSTGLLKSSSHGNDTQLLKYNSEPYAMATISVAASTSTAVSLFSPTIQPSTNKQQQPLLHNSHLAMSLLQQQKSKTQPRARGMDYNVNKPRKDININIGMHDNHNRSHDNGIQRELAHERRKKTAELKLENQELEQLYIQSQSVANHEMEMKKQSMENESSLSSEHNGNHHHHHHHHHHHNHNSHANMDNGYSSHPSHTTPLTEDAVKQFELYQKRMGGVHDSIKQFGHNNNINDNNDYNRGQDMGMGMGMDASQNNRHSSVRFQVAMPDEQQRMNQNGAKNEKYNSISSLRGHHAMSQRQNLGDSIRDKSRLLKNLNRQTKSSLFTSAMMDTERAAHMDVNVNGNVNNARSVFDEQPFMDVPMQRNSLTQPQQPQQAQAQAQAQAQHRKKKKGMGKTLTYATAFGAVCVVVLLVGYVYMKGSRKTFLSTKRRRVPRF